tara:strand:- start:159 stop:335 length:177 start_codon:yes stop_codon:yes gene_type:complete
MSKTMRKRARNEKGHYVADDPSTPFRNEAYEKTYTTGEKILFAIIVIGIIAAIVFGSQ